MAKNDSNPEQMEFLPASTDEGMMCSACSLRHNCPFPSGMQCQSIRSIREKRAQEMRSIRRCTMSDQFRTYEIIGGLTVSRGFGKRGTKVIAKIRDRHPSDVVPPERTSCKCVVTLKLIDPRDITDPVNVVVDFRDVVMLDFGYANMAEVKRILLDEIQKWYNQKITQN